MQNGVLAIGRALGVVLALGFVASPASAQSYRDGYDGPRRYDDGYSRRSRDDDDGYGRRRYGDDGGRRRRFDDEDEGPRFRGPPRGGRSGSVCITARGSCATGFAPPNAPCACDIPGFGVKRGAVAR
ncbi:hypothetical protein [Methylorubrum extorquens]|uniref:hypothetical protein n=1 Tax=Methylorubrum extorquens TaxID=408 RepID=UPI00209CBEA9|nr:hypothetical protein [Methylorubrum extorquens]MCP1536431.1 hypothetical protein [Methylorubrum extorquens]